MPDKSKDKWVTVAKAVGILAVSDRTIRRRIDKGELETKLEGNVRFVLIGNKSSTMPDSMSGSALIEQMREENEHLRKYIETEKDSHEKEIAELRNQLKQKDEDLRRKDEQSEGASERSDTIIMTLSKNLSDASKNLSDTQKALEMKNMSFWQRLRLGKGKKGEDEGEKQ